jgi:hypothetical protein
VKAAQAPNGIRRERQQDGINKAKAEGVRFGPNSPNRRGDTKDQRSAERGPDRPGDYAANEA